MILALLLLLQSASALRVSNGANANLEHAWRWPSAGGMPSPLQLLFSPPVQQQKQDSKGNVSKHANSTTWRDRHEKAKNGTSASSGAASAHSGTAVKKDDHLQSSTSHSNHTSGKKVDWAGSGWNGKGNHSVVAKAAKSAWSGASHKNYTSPKKVPWAGSGWNGRGKYAVDAKAAKSGKSSASHWNATSGKKVTWTSGGGHGNGFKPSKDVLIPPFGNRDHLGHSSFGGPVPVSSVAPGSSRAASVWVHAAYPRCGSSTVLSMVEAAFSPVEQANGKVFALFEPCHGNVDRLSKKLEKGGCKALIDNILNCSFREINNLWGWSNPHSKHAGNVRYVQGSAERSCKAAGLRTFKTVLHSMLPEMRELLSNHSMLHIVDVVRDPRAIVASWRRTPGMNLHGPEANGSRLMLEICRDFAEAMTLKNDRVYHLVYEDLLRNPDKQMWRLFKALGFQYGAFQRGWIKKTFEVKDCKEGPYADCHLNPEAHLTSWRSKLPLEEQEDFKRDNNCTKIAKAYGWPL